MSKYIKVSDGEDQLKNRIKAIKGRYTLDLWCYQVLEREVEKLEKAKAKKEMCN